MLFCLVFLLLLAIIDERILPGFANETIQHLGLGLYKGLHVRVKLEMGLYVKPAIKVHCY
jgi:hypothetical protein